MSALRTPGFGPIVGHVSDTTGCIWIRGGDVEDKGAALHSSRRTIGVIAVTPVPSADRDRDLSDDDRDKICEQIAVELEADPNRIRLHYFRLHREYDRTGTFWLGDQACIKGNRSRPLKPQTQHLAMVGTLTIDDPYDDDENISDDRLAERLPDPQVWARDLVALPTARSTASFTTFADKTKAPGTLNFILGSCRYPGVLWKAKEADAIFAPVLDEALGRSGRKADATDPPVPKAPADFVLMVGDQIYADMLNRHVPIGLADTFEEFQERYHTAFGSRNMRRLLRQVPNYMILDDHEIEDNWTQDRISKAASRKVFNLAIGAYMSYQWSHGPRSFGRRLYYHYECNGYPFFVMDTRTQRYMDDVEDRLEDNHLLGRPTLGGEEPGQMDRLLRWLTEQQTKRGDVPKFVVTSSVFAPNPMSARERRPGKPEQQVRWKEESDSWPAFPETRRAILSCMIKNGIQNVVFLSGDIHCANVAKLQFAGSEAAERLKAFSITSSAFYWPFPFADGDPSNFVHNSRSPDQHDTFDIGGGLTMDYVAGNFTQEDNFCRVDLDPKTHTLRVAALNKKGDVIRKRNWLGQASGRPIVSDLQLAPW